MAQCCSAVLTSALAVVGTNDYGETPARLGSLQELAFSRDMAVVAVDHHRKGMFGVEDHRVDALVGSTGKAGVADAILGLTTQQGKSGAHLRVKGRELEKQDLVLTWDPACCTWQCQGTAEEVELSGRRRQVLAILQAAYPDAMLAGEVAKQVEMHREHVVPLLNDLLGEGYAKKEAKQGREQPYRAARANNEEEL